MIPEGNYTLTVYTIEAHESSSGEAFQRAKIECPKSHEAVNVPLDLECTLCKIESRED